MIVGRAWQFPHALRYVGMPLVTLLAWDLLITLAYMLLHQHWVAVNELPMPLIGSALAIFLSLRNNNAYNRWWEARTLWGGIVNNSRTLARQVRLYLGAHPVGRELVLLQVTFVHALRCQLRKQEPWDEIARLVDAETQARLRGASNMPDMVLRLMAERIAALHDARVLDTIQVAAFDDTLRDLGNLQGGTERVKNTPIPRQYTVLSYIVVQLFCLLLPLAMVADLGYATPLGSTVVGFIFLALDRVGTDLEAPFENSIFDVPLTSITRTIEINLLQPLGVAELPQPVTPVAGVLW